MISDRGSEREIMLCLAGDTMLGRGVAEAISQSRRPQLFEDEIVEFAKSADLFVLNLECCISARGERWPSPGKPFFFRAPPAGVAVLVELGVDCVTLANNHALDYGYDALTDTISLLDDAGIAHVGAGRNVMEAREGCVLERGGMRFAVFAFTDHPREYAATPDTPGVAFIDLRQGIPAWVGDRLRTTDADYQLVSPHWGPNMAPSPQPYVRAAAGELLEAGADLVAGHSAHVFQGVEERVIFDLGDFIDDYAIDPAVRNDLGLLWLVTLRDGALASIQTIPLKLGYCFTRRASGDDLCWIRERFTRACAAMGTEVEVRDDRLTISTAVS